MSLRTLLAVGLAALPLAAQDTTPPPNIVLILADDLGYGDPRCYHQGSKIPTPNIDRLAREGLRCTDAHSPSSVCTPTRYGLLTGRYAWRTKLQRGVLWPWDPPLIEDERVTLPELLRRAGYATACIGKWHLGWNWPLTDGGHVADALDGISWPSKERGPVGRRIDFTAAIPGGPIAHGFDHYFGDDVPNFPPYTFLEDDRVLLPPTAVKPAGMFGRTGPAAPGWDLAAVLPTLAQRACAWLADAAAGDRPFFLYLPLTAPHAPIAPSTRFAGTTGAGAYGDFVAEVDWVVGEVLATLERTGRAGNTLILFTSDNGSPHRDGTRMFGPVGSVNKRFGHDPSHPWRGLKSDAWEGGHRVPFLVRWPGRVREGATSDAPLVLTDLYRTLARVVGQPVGEHAGEDSFDQGAVLFGDGSAPPVRDHLVHHSGGGVFAVREGRFKLILGKGSGGFSRWRPPADAPPGQLYDLEADPGESRNLYRDRPDTVARLRARLQAIRRAGRSVPADSR